jgi:hypothetical protein
MSEKIGERVKGVTGFTVSPLFTDFYGGCPDVCAASTAEVRDSSEICPFQAVAYL